MDLEDYLAERVNRARTLLVAQQLDAVIATSSSNFYYFTGVHIEPHERLLAFILPRQGDPVILAPKLHEEEFAGISIEARFWSDGQDTTELLGTVLPKEGNISVDSSWPSKSLLSLMAHRPNLRFVDSATTLSHLRLRKDARELCLLREAGVLTDRVMANVIGDIRVGMTELDVVERLKHFWRQEGVYELAFAPIVGVGANGAMPHHQPDATRIQPMDTVVIDMGGIWKHYLSDMTRTIVVGEVAQPVREAYSIVKQAQLAGMAAVKPGCLSARLTSLREPSFPTPGMVAILTTEQGMALAWRFTRSRMPTARMLLCWRKVWSLAWNQESTYQVDLVFGLRMSLS
ncbi:hypothetical protein GCM10025859_23540 [Alicyclobacillus fastidiosus]|nr:hypothetical protein GCM10025859_23540 [Alicyclobacillus fastidiosus]